MRKAAGSAMPAADKPELQRHASSTHAAACLSPHRRSGQATMPRHTVPPPVGRRGGFWLPRGCRGLFPPAIFIDCSSLVLPPPAIRVHRSCRSGLCSHRPARPPLRPACRCHCRRITSSALLYACRRYGPAAALLQEGQTRESKAGSESETCSAGETRQGKACSKCKACCEGADQEADTQSTDQVRLLLCYEVHAAGRNSHGSQPDAPLILLAAAKRDCVRALLRGRQNAVSSHASVTTHSGLTAAITRYQG